MNRLCFPSLTLLAAVSLTLSGCSDAVAPGETDDLLLHRHFSKNWLEVGPGAEYATIQEAIDAAEDGDKIVVHPGDYEGATIDRSVTLIGRRAHIVAADPSMAEVPRNGAFYIKAKDVTIEGFTFESDDPEVESFYAAIEMEDAVRATIKNNTFIGPVSIDDEGPNPVIGCEISHNRFFADYYYPGFGNIALFINLHNGDRDNRITHNVFTSSDLAYGSAIAFWTGGDTDNSRNTIKHNTFNMTGQGAYVAGIGIWWTWDGALTPPTGNKIIHNDFTGSTQGLSLQIDGMAQPEEARAAILEGNKFRNNKGLDLTDICPGWEVCEP
jgi:hypothetical protein